MGYLRTGGATKNDRLEWWLRVGLIQTGANGGGSVFKRRSVILLLGGWDPGGCLKRVYGEWRFGSALMAGRSSWFFMCILRAIMVLTNSCIDILSFVGFFFFLSFPLRVLNLNSSLTG